MLDDLRLKIENYSYIEDSKITNNNIIYFGKSKINSDYSIINNEIFFNSVNSKIFNNKMNFIGKIDLNPFNLNLNLNLERFNQKDVKKISPIIFELINTGLFFNKNLSVNISLICENFINNRLFDSTHILMNFDSGKINFDKSKLINEKFGSLQMESTDLFINNGELILTGNFNLNIENQKKFYRIFQIPKQNRFEIKDIFFNVDFNIFRNKIKIMNVKFNNKSHPLHDEVEQMLELYNQESDNNFSNWNVIKNFTNTIFKIYAG